MRNLLLTIRFLATVLLLLSPNFVTFAYGQSGCEGAGWGSPLESPLTIKDPFNNTKKPKQRHYGTDYKAADGDNVLSVADGNVLVPNGWNFKQETNRLGQKGKGWGKYVVIKHKDDSTTLYAHLQEGSTNQLYEGMPVNKGDTIGKADSTGGVSGPHLHLEYSPNGKWKRKSATRDPNPCIVCSSQEPATVTLSGPDAPTNGSQYTASGGTEPYAWSISKGSITQSGVVTVSGQCGTATITVKDSCGNQATKDVRLPGGAWVLVNVISYPYYCKWFGVRGSYPEGWWLYGSPPSYYWSCEVISGLYKTIYIPKGDHLSIYYGTNTPNYEDCVPSSGCVSPTYPTEYMSQIEFYEWRCQ
ncbi:MAG: hypothetical protein A3G39_06875 [Deltaproteobacteria bacterium RIFCSPLOWO2_12_FULL_43_16]|nr:MAG: hypothetical protein A2Z89_08680 [Deltaproteobacteria bacterium GWA2_43_19]OGQ13186.1 MAG: hypothetical protein A3D30_05360 [Deltaproteobacteria bacterium RIFCSPHIGHO2_02_FULL_43_33]OGQ57556.1 MAG: hypothetical protein A3G39_06875 [Deltaproteobacteria bacterium RIFCSPLOWO2_12_FULL_43_16]HBR16547.1 hypothetical protein [Deltaproteobacteria bacterium]